MSPALQIDGPLDATTRPVKDESGAASILALSTTAVGIGTLDPPEAELEVAGDVHVEKNGSPRLTLFSRGNGTQRYSLRATNDRDEAGGRRFIIRNHHRGPKGTDELILDERGNLTVAGDILLAGADCAEAFSVDRFVVEPGSVMVIVDGERLRPCDEPYDRRVAGVISGAGGWRPGIVLGNRAGAGNQLPLALTGRVYCRVDADRAPIDVGDMLTTSPSPGHAMKATDPERAFGAVLGKAMGRLAAGSGLVPVLVALQ